MADANDSQAPNSSWAEDHSLRAGDGRNLKRWGPVKIACKILDDCDRQVIYELIDTGDIKAYKARPHRPNSHWKVDLLSVWEHKQKQVQ